MGQEEGGVKGGDRKREELKAEVGRGRDRNSISYPIIL